MTFYRNAAIHFTLVVFLSFFSEASKGNDAETETPDFRRLALLIGINDYPSLPDSKQLRGCTNDVSLLRETLQEQAGFSESDVVTITNEQATRAGILRALDQLSDKVDEVNSQGTAASVVLHFSGHGSQVLDQLSGPNRDETDFFDQTLVPHDAEAEGGDKDIRDDELNAWACRVTQQPGNRLLIILDCCHSGTGLRGEGRKRQLDRSFEIPQKASFGDPKPLAVPKNVAVISACLATETEDECVFAGEDHGLLTAHLCKLAREMQRHGELKLRDLPELLRWQYLTRSTPAVPPHPQVELASDAESMPLFFASSNPASNARLGLLQVGKGGVGVLNRGVIDGVRAQSELKIVSSVGTPSDIIDLDAYQVIVTSASPTKSQVRVHRPTGSESGVETSLPPGKYLVLQQNRVTPSSIRIFLAIDSVDERDDWRRALSGPAVQVVDTKEDADRIVRIAPQGVRVETTESTVNVQDTAATQYTGDDPTPPAPSGLILLERSNSKDELSLYRWQAKVAHRLCEIAAAKFLTNLVAKQATETLLDQSDRVNPRIEMVVSKNVPPSGKRPELRPCQSREAGIPVLETGDIYALKITHPLASEQETYATIIHVDPMGEISIMCPFELSQTEIDRQRIDAEEGLLSSIFRCNGDALLDPNHIDYTPPVRGVHKAIVLFGTEPPDLSSLDDFLRSERKKLSSNPKTIQVEFKRKQNRSGDINDEFWWDAKVFQWISR